MRRIVFTFVLFVASASAFGADRWEPVALGVDYLHAIEGAMDVHVARVDLTCENIRIISTRESDRGTRVSDFAKRTRALVAINGDYFDKAMKPIGLTIGPCGQWLETTDTSREGVVAFGTTHGEIRTQSEVMDPPEPWIMSAVSGWPMLVRECHALTSAELPGSDAFTRSPHARTAVGVSKEGTIAYFVVADGRRADAPGLTLGQLSAWMFDHLGVCSAINLDGGGSSAMWVKDKIVNRPSDGVERRVGDHLAVVPSDQKIGCDMTKEQLAGSTASSGIGIAQSANRQ